MAKALGNGIAQLAPDVAVHSLAGTAAVDLATGMRDAMTEGEYSPDRIVFHYRRKPGAPAPSLPARMGTSVYWEKDVDLLRLQILSRCRALVVLGGGDWTEQEVQVAIDQGLPVIPLASTGGTARQV